MLSVTTFCTFLYEFSFFGFDSWAAVVIIEGWLPRLAIYADMTIASVNSSNRPAISNTQSTEASLAPRLTGDSSRPGPRSLRSTPPTWMSSVSNRNY
jgi:hypothetical protein